MVKKFQKTIFSVLLLVFTFFIIHDYVIEEFDTDTQYELCYAQNSDITLDTQTQIHQFIHNMLDAPLLESMVSFCGIAMFRPLYHINFIHERVEPVLYTPPIS